MNHKTKILLVDDHPLFRRGVRALLELKPEYAVVGEASNGCEAIEFIQHTRPDVIFMDINMPKVDGLEATRIIKKEHPEIHIIMLTVTDYDNALFEAIKSGASGYLLKNLEPSDLYLTLEKIQNGEAVINGVLANKILNEFSRLSQPKIQVTELDQLSKREIEVLKNLVKGMDNKEIAAALSISPSTVKTHLQNIIEKLHLKNRTEAAVYAIGEGIVDYRSKCDPPD
ncbi:MAG TPA: response regulator transcription factor [Anaerolineaceae bacterium]|nr:response regulator transcription factor [Anaerolineaceae bacterium]